jgi:lipopolysaccharide biosynthesis regulator YciM
MWFVVPILIIFIILCFLVAIFTIQNSQLVKLRYKIPLIPYEIPESEVNVVYVILISILIGIAIMIFFVAIAGIGWRYYAVKTRWRESKARKWLWEKREIAIAYSLMGLHQNAIGEFEKIIDKDNPHNELYLGLAEAFELKGDYQKAIENYNSVLTRDPYNMRALFGAAENWEALGNYSEAITMYNRILDFDDRSPKAIQKIQELLEKSGQYAEAIDMYQRSSPTLESPEMLEILASLYYRLAVKQIKEGDLKGAERTLKDSRKVPQYDFYVPSMLLLANLYMQTEREREARRLWEQTAERTLSTIIFRRLEDYYYNQKGEPRKNLQPVINLYKHLIEARDDANHLRLALGKLYLKLEDFDAAEPTLLEFQSKDPSIPQVHLLLADLYQRTDKVDKALDEYRFAAELVDIKIADFKCFKCGAMYEYWADQCTSCKSWGTIEDIFFKKGPKSVIPELRQKPLPQLPTASEEDTEDKVVSAS